MSKKLLSLVVILSLFTITACGHRKAKKNNESKAEAVMAYPPQLTKERLDKIITFWPDSSKAAISSLEMKYGLPVAATEEMVIWEQTAPFKRSIVYREEINHEFPATHADVLVQTLDYRVPVNKVMSLSQFDGSLLIDRTKGELSARNSSESMNILAFNLANQIVREAMTVEQARREFTKNAEVGSAGKSTPLMSGINFTVAKNTSDADHTMQSQEESSTRNWKKNSRR